MERTLETLLRAEAVSPRSSSSPAVFVLIMEVLLPVMLPTLERPGTVLSRNLERATYHIEKPTRRRLGAAGRSETTVEAEPVVTAPATPSFVLGDERGGKEKREGGITI